MNERNIKIPLRNLTSQLFSNIYLNELDNFVKRELRIKYYVRYADDFVILADNRLNLEKTLLDIEFFINKKLRLKMHPRKVIINTYQQGVDFLGYVVFPYYKILRVKTKKRILKKISEKRKELESGIIKKEKFRQTLNSYLGLLKHCKGNEIKKKIKYLN